MSNKFKTQKHPIPLKERALRMCAKLKYYLRSTSDKTNKYLALVKTQSLALLFLFHQLLFHQRSKRNNKTKLARRSSRHAEAKE